MSNAQLERQHALPGWPIAPLHSLKEISAAISPILDVGEATAVRKESWEGIPPAVAKSCPSTPGGLVSFLI